jgi:TPR repeat protein
VRYYRGKEAYYLSLLQEQGKTGAAQGAAEAFKWAIKSAAGNNGLGEILLGHIYQHGVGTAPNAELAQSWLDKGHAKMKQVEAAQIQQQARQAVSQAAVGAVLGLMFSGVMGDTDGVESADQRWERIYQNHVQEENHIRQMEIDHPSPQD